MKALLAATAGLLVTSPMSHADPIDKMLWTARPVVLVAPSPQDGRLKAQQKLLDAKAATLRGYDIKVVTATDDAARRHWRVGNGDFATILIGKDGGEKARWSAPVDPAKIFAEIDTMPMRKQEVGTR